MDEITIFYNYTPDQGNEPYFFPREGEGLSFQQLLYTYLTRAGERAFKKLDAVTYKMYEEYIDIPEIPTKDQTTITYIAIKKTYGYYFYFVDKVIPMPQGARCYIRLDNWATYIGAAEIKHVEVTRTNLYLGKKFTGYSKTELPFYTIERAPGIAQIKHTEGLFNYASNKTLSVYAVIKAQVVSTLSHEIDHINIYEFRADIFHDRYALSAAYNQDFFLNFVNAIASIDTLTGTWSYFGTGKAEIVKLYIAPNGLGERASQATFKGYVENSRYVEITGTLLTPLVLRKNILLTSPQVGYTMETIPGIDYIVPINGAIGNDLYFGTLYNQMKLPNIVDRIQVTYESRLNNNSIQFLLRCNGEEKDISESFTVTATSNNASITSQEMIAKTLNLIGNVAVGSAQIAAGGAGIITGGIQIASQANALLNNGRGQVIGGGDGLLTFSPLINYPNTAAAFLYAVYYGNDKPMATENINMTVYENICYNGAICKYRPRELQINDLKAYLGKYDFILTAINTTTRDTLLPFIQCIARVTGVPYKAIEEITSRLAEGVRLRYISGAVS